MKNAIAETGKNIGKEAQLWRTKHEGIGEHGRAGANSTE
jgi:hypothetical protein